MASDAVRFTVYDPNRERLFEVKDSEVLDFWRGSYGCWMIDHQIAMGAPARYTKRQINGNWDVVPKESMPNVLQVWMLLGGDN